MDEQRVEVECVSGKERCAGWLHLPDGPGPHPCAVMLHSTAGLRQLRCPPGPAAELAERAPAGRLDSFPCGHFDLYDGASLGAESAFLAEVLNGEPADGYGDRSGEGGIRTHEAG